MLEIAGGILIAVAVLVCLPAILLLAGWALIFGIGIAIWLVLAEFVGQGWSLMIVLGAVVVLLGRAHEKQPPNSIPESEPFSAWVLLTGLLYIGAFALAGIATLAAAMGIVAFLGWAIGPAGIPIGIVTFIVLFVTAYEFGKRKWSGWEEKRLSRKAEVA